jgi:cell wall-associated NlpC family hydrolase
VTTNDLASGHLAAGRSAATHRPIPGRALFLSILLALPALPALADDAGTIASSAATAPLAVSDPLPMADRSMLFGANLEQLIASQPIAARPEAREPMSEKIQSVMRRAMALLGTPYRWGGISENGFDCSGLVNYVFKSAIGIDLPRVSRDMARSGEQVERNALTAGDLVFFSRRGRRVDHVGIYVGNGQFVHAPRTGKDVMVSSLDTGYWSGKFLQARRVAGI